VKAKRRRFEHLSTTWLFSKPRATGLFKASHRFSAKHSAATCKIFSLFCWHTQVQSNKQLYMQSLSSRETHHSKSTKVINIGRWSRKTKQTEKWALSPTVNSSHNAASFNCFNATCKIHVYIQNIHTITVIYKQLLTGAMRHTASSRLGGQTSCSMGPEITSPKASETAYGHSILVTYMATWGQWVCASEILTDRQHNTAVSKLTMWTATHDS